MGSQRLSKSRWQQAENTLLDSCREIGKTMWPKVRDPPNRTMVSFVSGASDFMGYTDYTAYILKSSHLNLENGAAKTSQDDLPKNDYGWGTSWGFMGLRPPLRPSS